MLWFGSYILGLDNNGLIIATIWSHKIIKMYNLIPVDINLLFYVETNRADKLSPCPFLDLYTIIYTC